MSANNQFGDVMPKKEGETYRLDTGEMVPLFARHLAPEPLDATLNAYDDLIKCLKEGETIEAIVFGRWGWDGYKEPAEKPVPPEKQGVVLTIDEAKPMMAGWSYDCGYGAPQCYATNVWTNQRVLWITQYDGSTSIDSAPRNPSPTIPDMPGG